MSVVFDAVGPNSGGKHATSVSSISWTHTPVGIPTAVAVAISLTKSVSNTAITSVTYGGVTVSLAVSKNDNTTNAVRAAIFGLASPPSGAQTVVVNFASPIDTVAAASITVTGSDPATCFDNVSIGNLGRSVNPTDNACSSAAGDLVIDCASQHVISGSWSAGSGQTQVWMNADGSSSYAPGAASVTMHELTGTSDFWAIVSASFKAGPTVLSAYASMAHFWMGGAQQPLPLKVAGDFSMAQFWMGGAGTLGTSPPGGGFLEPPYFIVNMGRMMSRRGG